MQQFPDLTRRAITRAYIAPEMLARINGGLAREQALWNIRDRLNGKPRHYSIPPSERLTDWFRNRSDRVGRAALVVACWAVIVFAVQLVRGVL